MKYRVGEFIFADDPVIINEGRDTGGEQHRRPFNTGLLTLSFF